ncbi:MAG: MoxR family ATPase [Pirellulaceae bacterium]|nr:MoxR family ATPase [Pirellulaceae bacterium]
MEDWKIYHGTGQPDAERIKTLPPPPPWRDFSRFADERADTFQAPGEIVPVVNAALYLRRPVLVTGEPGTGKSSLAYAVSKELGLGPVLAWPINSRSTLAEGLYHYDSLARLRQASLDRTSGHAGDSADMEDIGRYIKLGPLGTAFTTAEDRPRALLIDEIDKSDIDLPNDLLHVLENGRFEIPELVRISDRVREVSVGITDPVQPGQRSTITDGSVSCRVFPFLVITSNGERELPPAFLRRCLRVDIKNPVREQLGAIVRAHLGEQDRKTLDELLDQFLRRREDEGAVLATDQLLNAVYLLTRGFEMPVSERELMVKVMLRELDVR